jgi:hypothetical protein
MVPWQLTCAESAILMDFFIYFPSREIGSITYCTTGVVLQWMRSNPTLAGISHIVLDGESSVATS